ncbi:hypothetical protein GO755_39750 [Spirosoma sp. HMF4905]|uniref:Uncharacterized protein n=1 Tax=Spirosoma arboris TaxID=2682092 RepID=A0A7K1SQY8_9BACT|nr:hypothetical protein [Spirosoma arboris]MVM36212.1 hypothetical protein [Spirosoma arboris]
MEPAISSEKIEAIQTYLQRAINLELTEQHKFATYSPAELTVIFPAIQKLLRYRQALKQQTGLGGDVKADLWEPSENNPRRTLLLVMRHTIQLNELLMSYKSARGSQTFFERRKPIDRLLSMNISDMNPVEYSQFKKLIGG